MIRCLPDALDLFLSGEEKANDTNYGAGSTATRNKIHTIFTIIVSITLWKRIIPVYKNIHTTLM